ncbi:MAG: lung seven transmembrane receptor family protein, partial [Proteobacteria bacterium]|nr:lung seven transmembrane receptor family protein [Pseudomonadota bacterium]
LSFFFFFYIYLSLTLFLSLSSLHPVLSRYPLPPPLPSASGLIMIAELVSAVKRALSRMLLIIVAMGFGTVKPRLGDSLGKVVAIGVVYTILAVMDGIIRARNVSQPVYVCRTYMYATRNPNGTNFLTRLSLYMYTFARIRI